MFGVFIIIIIIILPLCTALIVISKPTKTMQSRGGIRLEFNYFTFFFLSKFSEAVLLVRDHAYASDDLIPHDLYW